MKTNNHHPSKSQLMRRSLRMLQVQNYKNKIRAQYATQVMHNPHNPQRPHLSTQNDTIIDSHSIQDRDSIDGYAYQHNLWVIMSQIIRIRSMLIQNMMNQPTRSNQHNNYSSYMNKIISILIDCRQEEQKILKFLSEQAKYSELWNMEQRCLISKLYVSSLKDNRSQIFIMQLLCIVLQYLFNLLKGSILGLHLNSNQIEEQLLEIVVEQYLDETDKIANQNSQSYSRTTSPTPETLNHITSLIVQTYSEYLTQYLIQIDIQNSSQTLPSEGLIGNIKQCTIKQVIGLGIQNLNEYWLCSRQISINMNMIMDMAQNQCNNLICLLSQFTSLMSHCYLGEVQQFEHHSSASIQGTFIGLASQLTDFIIQFSASSSSDWLLCIKNEQLITIIHRMLSLRIYNSQNLHHINMNSLLSTYIVSCIILQSNPTSKNNNIPLHLHLHLPYSDYRQNKSIQITKNRIQILCLKIVEQFGQNGVNLDSEGNLRLRYLSMIGNGEVNQYYYNNLHDLLNNV